MCSTQKGTDILTSSDAFAWLSSFDKYGWVFGLERITVLLEKLGNPQSRLRVIHIAGSNGKGSVCRFISSILQKAGYITGLYLSPHVERFSERIVVNNKEISEEELTMLVSEVKPFVEEMIQQKNPPTFFEIVTALMFLHFKNRSVDYAVVEVGLGGRFDATNVIQPLVCVITNISLEHTEILGKDLTSIAREKAGIIKDHVPVITAATNDALETIQHVANERHASLVCVNQTMWKRRSYQRNYQVFVIQGSFMEYTVKTSLLGIHQGENIAVAIAAVEQLQMHGVYITDNDIMDGIASASLPGRMEIISENPLILLDGAHNPAGVRVLADTLKKDFSSQRLILVLGVLKEKDIRSMVSTIVPLADVVIVTRSVNTRAADPLFLKDVIKEFDAGITVFVVGSIPDAVDHARRIAQQRDIICVTGSLFTVGEARIYLLSGKNSSEKSVC